MKQITFFLVFFLLVTSCNKDDGNNNSNVVNGSYTKMILINNYIYTIHDQSLTTIDVSNPDNPKNINTQDVGFTIENIFNHKGVLFIGAEQGLTIYSIGTDGIPIKESQTNYFESEIVTSCDPVIVSGDIAYVTLSSTTTEGTCPRTILINELRIYNIADINNPILLSVSMLDAPKGLSIDGDYLFVCQQNKGVAVIDVSDPVAPSVLNSIEEFKTYDVIARDGLLMVVCPEEIRQYDYNDISNIELLSTLKL